MRWWSRSFALGATLEAVAGLHSVGSRIGKFEIINRIAAGGMAELYVARTRAAHGFEKVVALKRIFPHFLEDEDFVEMFLHEARLAARLHHPNIAQVYEIGDDDGVYFFTMEYVLGQDLRRIIRAVRKGGGWLTLDQIITIVTQTAAGLHYAHEREGPGGKPLGIVHRDISPSNLLVSYDGGVKLVDFGIARAASRRQVTQAGTLKGKIPYMSPEQCRGEPLDRRSDIYSLGIILWELALCRQLWAGAADFSLVKRIATEDAPAPTAFLPNFPKDLEAIIMRALAHDRDERYATAQEFQVDLEEFARERKLALSSIGLGQFMQGLFADAIAEQKAALVEARAGKRTLFPSFESSDATAQAPIDNSTTLVSSGELNLDGRERGGSRVMTALAVGVGALVLVAVGLGGWWFVEGRHRQPVAGVAEAEGPTRAAATPADPPGQVATAPVQPPVLPGASPATAVDAVEVGEVAEVADVADAEPASAKTKPRRRKGGTSHRPSSAPAEDPDPAKTRLDGIKNPFAR